MSYVGLGNDTGASCVKTQTPMPGTGTYMPGKICPETTGKTGNSPPRPRWCGGLGTMDVQEALKLAGLYAGPVDGHPNSATLAAIAAIAAAYNVAWDGDPWTIGPNLCGAIAAEVSKRAPACASPTWPDIGCIVPATSAMGPLPPPAPAPVSPPSTPSPLRFARMPAMMVTKIAPTTKPQLVAMPKFPMRATTPGAAAVQQTMVDEEIPQTPPELPPSSTDEPFEIPTWAYVAGGVALLGVVYVATR